MCLLWGDVVHKFIKAPCSVTLAANSISGYDMRRIAIAYDYFVNETLTMRRGCGFREATCPKTGISFSIREEWEPSLCAGVRRGSYSLYIFLPWILRCLDGGVDMSADTCSWIHARRQQAIHLDKQEAKWVETTKRHWCRVVDIFTPGQEMQSTEWIKQSSSFIARWWTMPTPDEDVNAYGEHQSYQRRRLTVVKALISAQMMNSDSKERGITVSNTTPQMHLSSLPTPTYYSERDGASRSSKPFIDIATKDGSKPTDHTYASIQFPHANDGLTSEWDRSDNGYAFTVLGGAMHGSLHAANGGGMFDWTAKYNDVDIGTSKKPGLAVTRGHLPYYNIHYHRESWTTTSSNIYVAFDHDEYKVLLDACAQYQSSQSSHSSPTDSAPESSDDCSDSNDESSKRQRRNSTNHHRHTHPVVAAVTHDHDSPL
jgi:hypothetical protein